MPEASSPSCRVRGFPCVCPAVVPPAGLCVVQPWVLGAGAVVVCACSRSLQPPGEPTSLWTALGGGSRVPRGSPVPEAAPLLGLSLLRSALRFLPGQLPPFTSGVKQWEDPRGVRVFPILWEMGFPLLRV